MSTSAKIRLLLAVVCATFLLTAFIVKQTFTPSVNLTQTGVILQKNVNKREAFINQQIGSKSSFDVLKQLPDSAKKALDVITNFTTDRHIWVYTYLNNRLKFWSGVKIAPDSASDFKEGTSFRKYQNGYYQVIKKTDGNFTALFFIRIKTYYIFQNRYLHDNFDPDLLNDSNIDIATITDKFVYNIHSLSGAYLFSVKLVPGAINHRFFYFELVLWLLGGICLCVLIHKSCNNLALKGYTFTSFGLLLVFICLIRFIGICYKLPNLSGFEIFKPGLYNGGVLFPTLGDFCINMLGCCWLASFIYYHRHRIIKRVPGKIGAYAITAICSVILMLLATTLLKLYYDLVLHSNINFDVTNVFNLTRYSLLGVLMLCFSYLVYYLFNDTFLVIARRLNISHSVMAGIFAVIILIATLITTVQNGFSAFYILTGLFTIIRAYTVWHGNGKLNAATFLCLLFVCSLIAALKLNYFLDLKETHLRKVLIQKLEVADDSTADSAFYKIEKNIMADKRLNEYWSDKNPNEDYLRNYLQKTYFDGYLGRYELKMYSFNPAGEPVSADKTYTLDVFKNLVAFSSIKVSKSFYHENDVFGYQSYFAILPFYKNDSNVGTFVISLRSKPLLANITFPELLVNGDTRSDNQFKDYSYAFYIDGKLITQTGKFAYRITNNDFNGPVKQYFTRITPSPVKRWYKPLARYDHLIYQPSKRYMIVVSREEDPIEQVVTSLTFFFVSFLGFSAIVVFVNWLWTRIRIFSIQNKQIKWGFKINADKVLYRSRIQFSVVFTVVFTLLIIGLITFRSISNQYQAQQDASIRTEVSRIGAAFQEGLQKGYYSQSQAGQVRFNEFAQTYQVDLTLFDKNGVCLISTQPKIYDYKLLAPRINGRVFINMDKMLQSVFLNDEKLGELSYKSAYIPIRDHDETVAYLQLPYFSNESEVNERIGPLLNAMINVYALVFIAIGLFAVVIARQITSPLGFIQQSLSRTIYGQKNEPIVWDRDDEIGAMVKEYNNMISQLENSAQRLAQSERESAWREMAKQVAHEIKNPLTPLKLGLQLLDKAWKDKDPKFDQKFERFSKSFVEQIESLSSIASEFSAFAKMPDTKLERVDLFEIISQAVIIFKQMDNITINYQPGDTFLIRGDRNQLLRCFNNLLKNAIEAIPDDRPGEITISYKINTGNVLLVIQDNGNGIPENLREKIFAPNFTTKSSGTGLGLAFVKNSIENAGGRVWFETEMGKGTTFYLNLPAMG